MFRSSFPESLNITLCDKRNFADVIEYFEMRGLSYIISVGPINHKHPYTRKVEGNLATEEEKVM